MTIGFDRATTPKASVRPTPKQLAWAAGFLEGEGYFGWRFRDNPNWSPSFRITAVQVQREPLDLLQQLFGGKISPRPARGKSQAAFTWHVSGSRALGIALTLYQFMSTKRKAQITEGLAEARVGHGNKTKCINGHDLTDENAKWQTRDGKKIRKCRECTNRWWREWYHKSKSSSRSLR